MAGIHSRQHRPVCACRQDRIGRIYALPDIPNQLNAGTSGFTSSAPRVHEAVASYGSGMRPNIKKPAYGHANEGNIVFFTLHSASPRESA
jgi:hypothetical protein